MTPTLVVLRALGLGDFLTAVPAYRALARAFPRHRRVLAAPVSLAPLVGLLDGAFDELADTTPLAPLARGLHGADVAINLHGRGPQSHRVLLAARPARLIAYAHPEIPETSDGPAWDPEEHEVLRWCRLLAVAGIPAIPGQLDLALPAVEVPAAWRGATVLHAGAASEARRWPADRWAAVAAAERRRGRTVLLTGGADEAERVRGIAARAGLGDDAVLAGRTGLDALAALVAHARCVVSGDTGIAHVATAYRTPSVVLFGPVAPTLWGPPRHRRQHRVLWSGTVGDPHANAVDAGLLAIGVGDVLDALDAVSPLSAAS